MAEKNHIQTSFIKGALSPYIRGRLDFQGYFDGADFLENVIVLRQGGLFRRSGTRFVAEVKTSANLTRLLPFVHSIVQAYIIEAGNLYFRFYTQEAQLISGTPVEIVTPYTTAQLDEIDFAQSADVMYLSHPDHRPRELRRTSPTTFSLVNHDFSDGPYEEINKTAITLVSSAASGSTTITASASLFVVDDVDRLIRIKNRNGGGWSWCQITAFISVTQVTALIRGDAMLLTATVVWRLGTWHGPDNWPATVSFHEERLSWGRKVEDPQRFWASVTGDFPNHRPNDPITEVQSASDALNVLIASDQVNAVNFIKSTDVGAFLGVSSSEVLIQPASQASGLTATNIRRRFTSAFGARANVRPIQIERFVMFSQFQGFGLISSEVQGLTETLDSNEISLQAEHLFRPRIKRMAVLKSPIPTVYILMEDGSLVGMTFDSSQKVLAFYSILVGGTFQGSSQAVIEDIAAIPSAGEDQLWLSIKRTINSVTKRYVEFIETPYQLTELIPTEAFFVDSGLSATFGSLTTVLTGLDHLEGETVSILGDGAKQAPKVVVAGSITLDTAILRVHAGLTQVVRIGLLPIEEGQIGEETSGKIKKITHAYLQFDRTVGAETADEEGLLEVVKFRSPSVPMGQAVPLFTGIKRIKVRARHGRKISLIIKSSDPLPFHLLSVTIPLQV